MERRTGRGSGSYICSGCGRAFRSLLDLHQHSKGCGKSPASGTDTYSLRGSRGATETHDHEREAVRR